MSGPFCMLLVVGAARSPPDQPRVRCTQLGSRGAETTHECERKAGTLNQPSAQGIVAAGALHGARAGWH
eukprot:357713-Chlamydomonas_euryale.AAC.22